MSNVMHMDIFAVYDKRVLSMKRLKRVHTPERLYNADIIAKTIFR